MRREIQDRLDAVDRSERIRRRALWVAVPVLFALAAYVYFQPSTYVGGVSGAVERSVVGTSEFGNRFHQLSVRLGDGRVVSVGTYLMVPLEKGRVIHISQRRGWMGNTFYRLERKAKPKPE